MKVLIVFIIAVSAGWGSWLFLLTERKKHKLPFRVLLRNIIHAPKTSRLLREQWPSALLFLSETLRSGSGLWMALETLKTDAPEPLRSHLERRIKGRDWLPLETQIKQIFSDPFLSLARVSLLLSHETGGTAAGLLEKAARLISENDHMIAKAKTLTAQGKTSAWIVGLSPLVLIAVFSSLSPDYMRPLFETRAGIKIIFIVFVMVILGLFFVHRAAALE